MRIRIEIVSDFNADAALTLREKRGFFWVWLRITVFAITRAMHIFRGYPSTL